MGRPLLCEGEWGSGSGEGDVRGSRREVAAGSFQDAELFAYFDEGGYRAVEVLALMGG